VLPLVRPSTAHSSSQGISWDPQTRTIDAPALENLDCVIHLAGRSIADGRWNHLRKREIEESRVQSTEFLISTLRALKAPPKLFLCASAVGFYGSRPGETVTETSAPGTGFLSTVCQRWEAEARRASEFGALVCSLRFGIVLGREGGALQKMALPFKLGLGGNLGSGDQMWSWISLTDAVRALAALITTPIEGPVNIVSPSPVTNREFTRTVAHVLRRPAFLHVPAAALKLALGEMAEELFLSSTEATPTKLLAAGFEFAHPTLEEALRVELG
jgi:uncharacterized protein (TIGR01777 family)